MHDPAKGTFRLLFLPFATPEKHTSAEGLISAADTAKEPPKGFEKGRSFAYAFLYEYILSYKKSFVNGIHINIHF